jgi:hypothetical protein
MRKSQLISLLLVLLMPLTGLLARVNHIGAVATISLVKSPEVKYIFYSKY